jgi:hypothetical protein
MAAQVSCPRREGVAGPPGERRSGARHPWYQEVPLRAVGAGNEETHWASVRDISDGGIGLLLSCPFRPGTVVTMELRGAGQPASRMLVGRVVHATRQPHGNYALGCAFQGGGFDRGSQAPPRP